MSEKPIIVVEEADGPPGAPGWVVSFADLMTLLFATFVVLYGLSQKGIGDAKKVLTASAAIRESFNETPDSIPIDRQENPTSDQKLVFEHFKRDQLHQTVVKKNIRPTHTLKVINSDIAKVQQLVEEIHKGQVKNDKDESRKIFIKSTKDGFSVQFMSSVFYEPGDYRVKREALPTLDRVGGLLKDLGRDIKIEGHTDSTPMTGKLSNWELSSMRAGYIARHFIKVLDFPPGKIETGGYADTKPYTSDKSAAGRKINRRIEIKVHYEE